MTIKKNIESELDKFRALESKKADVKQKLDELVLLLGQVNLDSEDARQYKEQFEQALQKSTITRDQLKVYEELDNADLSRMDMLNELGRLLNTTPLDSNVVQTYRQKEWASKVVTLVIGLVMIGLGFGMIAMPQPASFEMFTLFYITPNDGVTIMDVISLLIVLTGIYFVITALKKHTA